MAIAESLMLRIALDRNRLPQWFVSQSCTRPVLPKPLPYLLQLLFAIPAPTMGTCMGLPGELVTIFIVADSCASSEGLNFTATVQLFPGPRFPLLQYSMTLKSAGFPETSTNEMGPMCTCVEPLLCRITT